MAEEKVYMICPGCKQPTKLERYELEMEEDKVAIFPHWHADCIPEDKRSGSRFNLRRA